jgi:predicted RNA-binding protein YlxR (DUF448 family)
MVPAKHGHSGGRGFYLCPNHGCFKRAQRKVGLVLTMEGLKLSKEENL